MPAPPICDEPLPYQERLEWRPKSAIDLVVIHCTELPDLDSARRQGEQVLYADGTGNSGHCYVDRDGAIHQFVANERIAHHTHGYNPRSIGIELVNLGRYPGWLDSRSQTMSEPYPTAQIRALLALLVHLREALPNLRWIAGHEDLDQRKVPASDDPGREVSRKRDPGPMFPWPDVVKACPLQRLAPDAPVPPPATA